MYFILYQCSAETKIGVVDIKTESVQFHVQNKGNRHTDGKKFTFPSKEIFLKIGNGFDWSNQWFLAPYSGTYFFSLSGTKSFRNKNGNHRRVSIFIDLNGKGIGEAPLLSPQLILSMVHCPSSFQENWKKVINSNL